MVRLIARAARPKDPERITQREFDAAREPSGHVGVPRATTICARLADRDGKPMPWQEVLNRSLDPTASAQHAERQRLGEPDARYLDLRHVIYALRLVASRRGAKGLTPDEYAEERRTIIVAEGRRRNLRRRLQAELLPTVGQIEVIVRDIKAVSGAPWDKALALSELEPRSTLREQRFHRGPHRDSLPMVELIHHYVEANGELPSRNDYEEFRKLAAVKVETRKGTWKQHLEATIKYRETLGLTEPRELPTIAGRRGRGPREIKLPAGGIPGAAPRLGKGRRKYTEADCVAAVRRYLEEVDGPHTQKGYLVFSGRHGLPAPSEFDVHGGWRELRRKAKAAERAFRSSKEAARSS